jgi:hypothetical protein
MAHVKISLPESAMEALAARAERLDLGPSEAARGLLEDALVLVVPPANARRVSVRLSEADLDRYQREALKAGASLHSILRATLLEALG